MAIKNLKAFLLQAVKYPAAIEAKLPEAVPKLSTMMLDAANQVPVLVDFPVELPDLPAVPEIPAIPGAPGGLGKRFVTGATVTQNPDMEIQAVLRNRTGIIPSPTVGVLPEVISRRGF